MDGVRDGQPNRKMLVHSRIAHYFELYIALTRDSRQPQIVRVKNIQYPKMYSHTLHTPKQNCIRINHLNDHGSNGPSVALKIGITPVQIRAKPQRP